MIIIWFMIPDMTHRNARRYSYRHFNGGPNLDIRTVNVRH